MKQIIISVAVMAVILGGSACSGVYQNLKTGDFLKWGISDNPSPSEAAKAWGKLEDALQDNLEIMRSANKSGKRELFDLAARNVQSILEAKKKLASYLGNDADDTTKEKTATPKK